MKTEKETMAEKGYLPVTEVAERLGKQRQTVQYWAEAEKVIGVKIGHHWYVLWTSVVSFYREKDPRALELLGLNEETTKTIPPSDEP